MPAGTNLLEAIRTAGLPIASACDAHALCGRCAVRVLEGKDALAAQSPLEAAAKRRNRVTDELRLACRVVVEEELEITTDYW